MAMGLLAFQLVSLFSLLGISVVGVAIPFCFPAGKRGDHLLSCGNSFAGGVMLGAGFLHMLVDATDDLSTLEVFNSTTFLPHLLSVVGILIPFALEKSGILCCESGNYGEEEEEEEGHTRERRSSARSHGSFANAISLEGRSRRLSMHKSLLARTNAVTGALMDCRSAVCATYGTGEGRGMVPSSDPEDGVVKPTSDEAAAAKFANFMMLAILSIHSILAGLAVGVSGSASGVGILIALLIHKLFEALVMGVSTVKANQALGTRAAEIVVYVLATPLGVLIGLIVSEFGAIPLHAIGVIVGLSSGTFVYIALVEIVCDEFGGKAHNVGKFAFFCFGVAVMAVLGVFI